MASAPCRASRRSASRTNELRIVAPRELGRYLTYKGSITVDYCADGCESSINLIPHTVEVTMLRYIKAGDMVTLEVNMIARYVERMLSTSQGVHQD
ncbi:riboflavin synthase subunit alpha [Burkholderia lata]|nr:riboflavin synthase subunit alpha [Burkholderia lata]